MDDEKVVMKVDISHKMEGKYIKQYHDRNLEQYLTPIMNPDKEYCYCILCKKIFNDRYRFQGRAVGFEKGGPDLVGDPPKKIITRPDPPKKSKSPQFWATSK